jgi:isocitrate/isopropylmalate dehydrogenase
MFEPIHGSAPKYAGKGLVNPVAAIESIRMMMEHLGETEAGKDIEAAVNQVLQNGTAKTTRYCKTVPPKPAIWAARIPHHKWEMPLKRQF